MKVSILSFSFKRGIPDDPTGNGGSLVFDCRAMPNPHAFEELRHFTGLDKPVADFFAKFPKSVESFLEAAETLVRHTIGEYMKDGRKHLQVAFGCTGGQHRSVYFAERMAANLRKQYKSAEIEAVHTARPFWRTASEEV